MAIDLLSLPLWFLNQVSYWANYKIQFTGLDTFSLPLGLIGMLGFSILLLEFYSWREFFKRK